MEEHAHITFISALTGRTRTQGFKPSPNRSPSCTTAEICYLKWNNHHSKILIHHYFARFALASIRRGYLKMTQFSFWPYLGHLQQAVHSIMTHKKEAKKSSSSVQRPSGKEARQKSHRQFERLAHPALFKAIPLTRTTAHFPLVFKGQGCLPSTLLLRFPALILPIHLTCL